MHTQTHKHIHALFTWLANLLREKAANRLSRGNELSAPLLSETHFFLHTHTHAVPPDIFRLSVLLADLLFVCICSVNTCMHIWLCVQTSVCVLLGECVCMRASQAVSEFDLKLLLPLYSASSCVRFLGLQDMRGENICRQPITVHGSLFIH